MTFEERVSMYIGTTAFNAVEAFGIEDIPDSYVNAGDGMTAEEQAPAKYKEALGRFLREAVVDVVEKSLVVNPDDLHLFCQNLIIRPMDVWEEEQTNWDDYFVPFKDADGGYKIENNHLLWVGREFGAIVVPCHEISPEKALRIQDPESIYFTGVDYRNPIYYKSSGKVYIFPDTTSLDEGRASALLYDDSITADKEDIKYFPKHLYHLVAIYAAIRALRVAAHQKRREYEKYNTPLKVWNELYAGTNPPTVPVFPTNLPDWGDDNLVDYPFGDEASNMSQVFTNLWSRIQVEEDVELATTEIGRFNAMMSEYQNQLGSLSTKQQNLLTSFTAQLSDFNSKWDTMMKVWTQKVSSYNTEITLLKSDITDLIQQYNQSFFPKSVEEKMEKQD
tara:strand:- start:476 stop:1648 length:1173 start_codon:yes stop_codon:yes gene_type:complete